MSGGYFAGAAIFVLDTIFGLYIGACWKHAFIIGFLFLFIMFIFYLNTSKK